MTKENLEPKPFQIVVDKNRLKREIERVLIECSNAVFIGLAAIDKLNQAPKYIYGEDDFITHKPFLMQMNLEESKKYFKSWVVKKGFEDLIKGITLMLIDVCKVIKKQKKILELHFESWEELKEILASNEYGVSREHFPKLIGIVQPYLTGSLSYLDEINSINRVRRCLVHRDGLVTPIDFQSGTDKLKLSWVYPNVMYEENGVQRPLAPMMLMTGGGNMVIGEQRRQKEFVENDKVEIEYQLFNELIYTAFQFGEDLIRKLTFSPDETVTKK